MHHLRALRGKGPTESSRAYYLPSKEKTKDATHLDSFESLARETCVGVKKRAKGPNSIFRIPSQVQPHNLSE